MRVHTSRPIIVALALACAASALSCRPARVEQSREPMRLSDIRLARETDIIRAIVPPRTTLAALLNTHKLLADEAVALVQTLSEQFDPRRLRAGQPYRLIKLLDGRIRQFEYEIDMDRRLVVRRSDEEPEGFAAEIAEIPKIVTAVVVEGSIDRDTPSLIQAMEAAGERIELSLALAEVFSGELDFNSDPQPGDTFRLVVERGEREDGAFAGYGPVLAAEYVNAGRTLQALRFTPPGGKPAYYDAEGRSLKRFFLKSPLKFEPRITSSFSRSRRHPILDYVRAHNGVDYSAPPGAPVVAVAGGVVTFAGWNKGGGRTVKVRHPSGYDSEYLHLSSIAVRSGARVGQGDLIGRVGSSGLATGPHLHYGLKRDGRYVNPVREHQNMPPGEPVSRLHRAAFEAHRDGLFGTLAGGATRAANNDERN